MILEEWKFRKDNLIRELAYLYHRNDDDFLRKMREKNIAELQYYKENYEQFRYEFCDDRVCHWSLEIKVDELDEKYPHHCINCGDPLKFSHLCNRNPTISKEILRQQWMTLNPMNDKPLFQYYCCSCFSKIENYETLEDFENEKQILERARFLRKIQDISEFKEEENDLDDKYFYIEKANEIMIKFNEKTIHLLWEKSRQEMSFDPYYVQIPSNDLILFNIWFLTVNDYYKFLDIYDEFHHVINPKLFIYLRWGKKRVKKKGFLDRPQKIRRIKDHVLIGKLRISFFK